MFVLMEVLTKRGANMAYLCGQGCDEDNMAGQGMEFKQEYPVVAYAHCASPCLNLLLCDTCTLPVIRNAVGAVFKNDCTRAHWKDKRVAAGILRDAESGAA